MSGRIKRKRKKNETTTYVPAMLLFIAAVTISLLVFLVGVQSSIESGSQNAIKTNVSRQSEHVWSILDIHYGYLNGIAAEMGKSDELMSKSNKDMLVSLRKATNLERVALFDADGNAYYDNGAIKNVASRRYFKEAMDGHESLSDPLESSVDKETRVVLAVPVRKDGKVVGVLGGSYNVTSLSRMLFNDFFGGIGYTLITTCEGEIIAHDGDAAYHKINYGDNFFEFYDAKILLGGSTLKDVEKDFAEGKEGLIKMRSSSGNESDKYLAYTDLGMNDWMICYVIPVSEAQKTYNFIRKYELMFTAAFIVMIFILLGYVFRKSKAHNKLLLQAAQIDGLTGAFNKRSTEERINDILWENPKETHMFVIMDLDRFKEVNDRYGHMIGDEVLRNFGNLLKEYFREEDVIGRIGGDEFVVLMRKIEHKENAVERIENLIKKMEECYLAEMDGENVTISAGISFAPECGNSYMDLYKAADTALYETKKAGRNGYHIYKG